jgi:quinol monooxygenase YgiN
VVFSLIELLPLAKQRTPMMEILRGVSDLTQAHPDCLGCWLDTKDEPPDRLRYVEQWATEAGLQEHIRSELYRRVLAAIELSSRPPGVHFYYISRTKGMELIEALRSPLAASTHND